MTMSRRKVLDLSFAGCGFLTMYHIGALAAFRSASDSVVINRCLGASGGSIVACATVANLDIVWLEAVFRDLVKSVGSNRFGAFSRNFDVGVILKVWMNNLNLKLIYYYVLECVSRPPFRYSYNSERQTFHFTDKCKVS